MFADKNIYPLVKRYKINGRAVYTNKRRFYCCLKSVWKFEGLSADTMVETQSLLQNMNLSGLQVKWLRIFYSPAWSDDKNNFTRALIGQPTVAIIQRKTLLTCPKMVWCLKCQVMAKHLRYLSTVKTVQVSSENISEDKYFRKFQPENILVASSSSGYETGSNSSGVSDKEMSTTRDADFRSSDRRQSLVNKR